MTAANLPIFRLGFFADDFIFFDAVRRMNVVDVLLGRNGIYPWYRPLSRELFFYLLLACEPAALFLSHAISLAAVAVSAWCLHEVGRRLLSARAGVIAAAVFATAHLTRFVSAWASTFQDNLAVALVLGAIVAQLEKRVVLSLVLACAAPFAKETGFLVWPLLIAAHVAEHRRLPGRRWFTLHGIGFAAVALAHALVRLSWVHTGNAFKMHPSPAALAENLRGFIASFAPWGMPPREALPIALGLIAAAACAWMLSRARRESPNATTAPPPWHRGFSFAVLALLAGLAPLTVGHLLSLSAATTYYSYPAVPWGALVIAALLSKLRRGIVLIVVPAWVVLSVWGLPYRDPDLERFSGWVSLNNSTWWEQVRISVVTDRMRIDLIGSLASRAESTVVLYSNLPYRSFLQQSGDGPATREMLHDRTVVGLFVSDCPREVRRERMAMMMFDPEACHLRLMPRTHSTVVGAAAGAVTSGFPLQVWSWFEYGGLTNSHAFDISIVRAAARFSTEGVGAYQEEMRQAGLTDTLGDAPSRLAVAVCATGYPASSAALECMLRSPRTTAGHAVLAESLLARGSLVLAGLEARTALGLGGSSCRAHYLLGRVFALSGQPWQAVDEFRAALSVAAEEPFASRARLGLEEAGYATRQMTKEVDAVQRGLEPR